MIIGIGHKCRQGKDTVADYLVKKYGFIKIGFADALREECRNCEIHYTEGNTVFKVKGEYRFDSIPVSNSMINWIKSKTEVIPYDNYIYKGMTEKDTTLLQWWGTDFRRKQDEDYWVKIVRDKILNLHLIEFSKTNPVNYARNNVIKLNKVIPDTRFENEAKMIKDLGGEVWKVERYDFEPLIIDKECRKNNYATPIIVPYTDPSRNPNHPSETDLDDYPFDRVLSAESGDLGGLYNQVDKLLEGENK